MRRSVAYLEHGRGAFILAHDPAICAGRVCSLHSRTDHRMRSFRQLWRSDRALMERICPHGIGHPDPDHLAWSGTDNGEDVHGCDGCCQEK